MILIPWILFLIFVIAGIYIGLKTKKIIKENNYQVANFFKVHNISLTQAQYFATVEKSIGTSPKYINRIQRLFILLYISLGAEIQAVLKIDVPFIFIWFCVAITLLNCIGIIAQTRIVKMANQLKKLSTDKNVYFVGNLKLIAQRLKYTWLAVIIQLGLLIFIGFLLHLLQLL